MSYTPSNLDRDQACHGCHPSRSNITPTPGNYHAAQPHRRDNSTSSKQTTPSSSQSQPLQVVYIVSDTCYATRSDFSHNKGTFRIDSVHSQKKNANARAKKIIYDTGQCHVDLDKIIEETRRGLFTGIGVGGKEDGNGGGCYARKCQVERKMVDEDSEDEEGFGDEDENGEDEKIVETNGNDRDSDFDMG